MAVKAFLKNFKKGQIVAFDSMVFIYLLEGHKIYFPFVKPLFKLMEKGKIKAFSSIISYIETLSSPLLDKKRIESYSKFFLKTKNLFLKKVDFKIAEYTAYLRRVYKLRTPDAIQMATAISKKADLFISNDDCFKKVKEVKTLVLKDFV